MPTHTDARHSPVGDLVGGPLPSAVLRTADSAYPPAHTLIELSNRLRPRDYTVAALLDQHTTLTTDQLTAVLFSSPTTCRHRLQLLRQLGFIDRFIRNRPGAANPVCWVPGLLSARYTSLAVGDNPPTARALRERQDRIYASPTLEHLLQANQFFITLLAHARRNPGFRLTRWWSERATAAAYGQRIKPDGHGVWTDGTSCTGWFLELDRGTEPIGRLLDKLAAYRRLRAEGGPGYPVLFVLPNRIREQNLHRRLADRPEPSLTIATTCPESGSNPVTAVWRLAGNGRHRIALHELPSGHGQPGPLNPGAPEAHDDPLWLLTQG